MNLNWFKSNIKRYFEIDVNPITLKKNDICWLPETCHSSDIFCCSDTGNFECNLPSIWRGSFRGLDGNNNGPYEKWCGYCKRDNRLHKRNSYAGGRAPFFITEVRTHYRHLNNDVYAPLAMLSMDLIRRDLVSPPWKKHFDIDGHIPHNFLDDRAIHHISEDSAQLLNEVREYQLLFDRYQIKLKSLQRTIDCIIKNRFIERGIYPTTSNNYHNLGYYIGEVNSLLELVWVDFVVHMDNLALYQSSNNITSRTFQHDGDYLRLDGYIIGRGNEPQRTTMQNIMENIPQNQIILDAFRDLRNSRDDLNNRAQLIRNLSQPFSNAISQHKTLLSGILVDIFLRILN